MEIQKENTSKEVNCNIIAYNGYNNFHWHENIEVCQIMNNCGSFLVDGNVVNAGAGDLVVIGEQVVHQFLIDMPDTMIRIFQMSPKALFDTGTSIKPLKTHITADEISSVCHLKDRLEVLFNIIQEDGGAERMADKPYMKAVASSVYFMLMHHFSEETNTKSHKERKLFYKITEYANSHFAEDISVQTLAEKMYVSRGKFSRVFTKYSGISFNHYLNTIRINNVNMLIDNGHPITQAALDSGFQNIRTFNGVYKKIMGITPSDYYKKYGLKTLS